jgi:hypothetical protein
MREPPSDSSSGNPVRAGASAAGHARTPPPRRRSGADARGRHRTACPAGPSPQTTRRIVNHGNGSHAEPQPNEPQRQPHEPCAQLRQPYPPPSQQQLPPGPRALINFADSGIRHSAPVTVDSGPVIVQFPHDWSTADLASTARPRGRADGR